MGWLKETELARVLYSVGMKARVLASSEGVACVMM